MTTLTMPNALNQALEEVAQQSAAAELDNVGQISQVVSDLRAQAELINSELRGQSGQLDSINDSADRNAAGLQRNAQRTRNLR